MLSYLHGVHADDPARPAEKAAGIRHSDRHHPLMAYLDQATGRESPATRQELREALAVEVYRVPALNRVTTMLGCAGIPSLILKGASLSYTVYPAPHLRPRNDDDLWIRQGDFEAACRLLESAGYAVEVEVVASDITRQRHFVLERPTVSHQIDLHWWPVNPPAFDTLPGFETCFAASRSLPTIGDYARAPGLVHAMVLAAAHRVAHHTATEDAMWLCDIHLLASSFRAEDWDTVASVARDARVGRVLGSELKRARDALGTPVPAGLTETLLAVTGEPSARHLQQLGPLGDLWLALRAKPGLHDRARLLRHHLVPPASYIAARYGYNGTVALPLLYVHRAVTGLMRWIEQYVVRRTR